MRTLLLNPGPVTLTERVRSAMSRPDMCHREQEFAEMQLDILTRIARVYPESQESFIPVMLTGSGTAAVEAMVGSVIPRDGRALVVANGVYGERMESMLKIQGKASTLVQSASWLDPMDLVGVERELARGGYTHVLAVHHETTTGRLNDMPALGALCKKYKTPLLLDAVSSFGGEEIRFEEWNLEACAATANKCLHGVPGISFVLVKRDVFEKRKTGATSVYLDLFKYREEQKKGFSPFTQSVQSLFALQEALKELEDQGGWKERHSRYKQRMSRVMDGLADLGCSLLIQNRADYSCILTSYIMPSGTSYSRLHDVLKEAGFVIYAGQGKFAGEIFRVAVMGDLQDSDLDRLLAETGKVLGKR